MAKRAVFKEIGRDGKLHKTRTIEWLCTIPFDDGPSCLMLDPDWNQPVYSGSPGMVGTAISPVATDG
jgi:hypothetical protein